MIWVDYCILLLIVGSVIIGALRGFTRETLGLATWLLAIALAWLFAEPVYGLLEPYIAAPSVRQVTAYAGLFLLGLLLGSLLTAWVVQAVRNSPFLSTDRTLGAGVGLVRGILLVAIMVLVAGMTPMREDPWWGNSLLVVRFEVLADELRHLIPPSWMQMLESSPAAPSAAAVQEQL